jgi:hypothetical protein
MLERIVGEKRSSLSWRSVNDEAKKKFRKKMTLKSSKPQNSLQDSQIQNSGANAIHLFSSSLPVGYNKLARWSQTSLTNVRSLSLEWVSLCFSTLVVSILTHKGNGEEKLQGRNTLAYLNVYKSFITLAPVGG